jgi:hypothetical protein
MLNRRTILKERRRKMTKNPKKKRRKAKAVRKEERVSARITQGLYEAVKLRAHQEQKPTSFVLLDALSKYLDYKVPPLKVMK